MTSSDDMFYSIVDDISRYTRSNYERILVELGLYSLHQLHDPEEGYVKILSKKEFILTTLEEKGFEPLIDTLVQNDMLSTETIKLLEENGYKLIEEKKTTSEAQNKSSNLKSEKSVSIQQKSSSEQKSIQDLENSSKTVKRNGLTWKIPTAITVAIIGCVGTFVTALFGYLAIKSQIEIPIKTTQTAEAVQAGLTANAPIITTPTEVAITTTPIIDWNTIIKTSSSFPQCGIIVAPEYISLNPKDMQSSLNSFSEEYAKQYGRDWSSAVATYLSFSIESSSQLNWAKVEDRFVVNVLVDSTVPDDLNIINVWGCGGGSTRDLAEVELVNQSNLSQYSVKLSYPDVDFFTLQPGEFESFGIPLICKAPGVYSITLDINVEYTGQQHKYSIVPPTKIYCPSKYTGWSSGYPTDLKYEGEYEWNGNKYQLVP